MFNYYTGRTRFWVVCWFGFAGWILTQAFIPDTTGLDLKEQDRYWEYVREGRAGDYHGIAVHPRHLSWYERFVLGRHKAYDPELDRQSRVKELRVLYDQLQASKTEEKGHMGEAMDDDDVMAAKTQRYFDHEKSRSLQALNSPQGGNGQAGPPYHAPLAELERKR